MTVLEDEAGGLNKAIHVLIDAGAREIYLFGSAADGNLKAGSDIDLAVSGLPARRFFRVLAEVSRCFDRPVDLVDLDEQNPFTAYLKSHGGIVRVG